MPGDLNSIGYLDVQFGAINFMSDSSSFDGVNDGKYNVSNLDNTTGTTTGNLDLTNANQTSTLEAYSPKSNAQSSISSVLTQSVSSFVFKRHLYISTFFFSFLTRKAFHKRVNTLLMHIIRHQEVLLQEVRQHLL